MFTNDVVRAARRSSHIVVRTSGDRHVRGSGLPSLAFSSKNDVFCLSGLAFVKTKLS